MSASDTWQEAVGRLSATDPDMWLGQLLWYGVSDVVLDHSELVQALLRHGLKGFMPRRPSDVDVFRRVCSASQRRKVPTGKPREYDNYLLRDLPDEDGNVFKVLVRESVRPGKIKYETELCVLTFSRAGSKITTKCSGTDVVANQIVSDIEDDFEKQRDTVNSYVLREGVIRKIVLSTNAVNVRGQGGGMYFVPKAHNHTIARLKAFAAEMPGTVIIRTVPLIDDGERRKMVLESFEIELCQEIDNLDNEVETLKRQGRSVTKKRIEGWLSRYEEMEAQTDQFQDMLEVSSDTARNALRIFHMRILRLAGQVAVK